MPKLTEGTYALGALTLFAFWLFVGLPFLYLPPEVRIQWQIPPYTTAPSAAEEPKGTPQAPFFIQVLPGADAAQKAAQEVEDHLEKQAADRWLVRWTMCLFFATLGLMLATGVLGAFAFRQAQDMRALIITAGETAKAVGDSASAAWIQANMAVSSTRAHMVPGFPKPVTSMDASWDVEIAVANTGPAAGTVGDTFVVFCDSLPSVPDYSNAIRQRDSTVLSGGQRKVIGTFQSPSRKEGQYCYGFIRFADEIGNWRRRFCVQIWAIRPSGFNFFHEVGGDEFNGEDYEGQSTRSPH
jgi:hypothetical protein